MTKVLGFTGTQKGMTAKQIVRVRSLIGSLRPSAFHHGDCIGADSDAHTIVRTGPYTGRVTPTIVIHPSDNNTKRANCGGDIILPPKPNLTRNRDIVDASDEMYATPDGFEVRLRSGTWATVRYANKVGKPVTVVWPDGTVTTNFDHRTYNK